MLKNVNTFPAGAYQIAPRPRPPPPWGASPPCPLPPSSAGDPNVSRTAVGITKQITKLSEMNINNLITHQAD